MEPFYQDSALALFNGNCIDVLCKLPDESVQCCVTSPPYWRQRDYGHTGQIGLEQTPEDYVSNLVSVFREVRRILKPDGTLWLNLGDKWASGGNGGGGSFMRERGEAWAHAAVAKGWRKPPHGYKDKDLLGLPWMTAFALRSDGWYLRQCNIWAKPNCMPESVQDRSTASHEYVFHLSKSNDYWYDSGAARTPPQPSTETRLAQDVNNQLGSVRANGSTHIERPMKAVQRQYDKQRGHKHGGFNNRWDAMKKSDQQANGANLRSVWWISPAQYGEDHFAVMPEQVAGLCIAAGCPVGEIVLDPFFGAGTTGAVAIDMGRKCIGIELNSDYAEMAKRRCLNVTPGLPFAAHKNRGKDE